MQTLRNLRKSSEEAINNGDPIRIPRAMAPGDMLPQGDIGLLMLSSVRSDWREIQPPENGQLAPGTSKGSRHQIPLEQIAAIQFFQINDGDPLSDLGLLASKPFDLTHPEHADHIGYPAGVYRVRHQQNEERMRVID